MGGLGEGGAGDGGVDPLLLHLRPGLQQARVLPHLDVWVTVKPKPTGSRSRGEKRLRGTRESPPRVTEIIFTAVLQMDH